MRILDFSRLLINLTTLLFSLNVTIDKFDNYVIFTECSVIEIYMFVSFVFCIYRPLCTDIPVYRRGNSKVFLTV